MITLAMVQRHLNADLYEPDERAYVMDQLVPAAREAAEMFLNRKLYDTNEELLGAIGEGVAGNSPLLTPKVVQQAMLLMIGDWYANREPVTFNGGFITTTAQNLMYPYRANPRFINTGV